MLILSYDEKKLRTELERLPSRLRAAFAAACAQRLAPSYLRFAKSTSQGHPEVLSGALGCLWSDLEDRPATEAELRQQFESCMSLLPDEDSEDELAYYAEDAVSAAAYAIGTRLEADIQQAIWSAQRAYNALDEFVGAQNPGVGFDRNEEERIRTHPLIQAELGRQRTDMLQLQGIAAGKIDERAGIAEVRHRALSDAKMFFGAQSA